MPRPPYPQERPGIHSIGGWVGPRKIVLLHLNMQFDQTLEWYNDTTNKTIWFNFGDRSDRHLLTFFSPLPRNFSIIIDFLSLHMSLFLQNKACIVYIIKSLNTLNFQFLCLGLNTHTPISVRERSCRSLQTPVNFSSFSNIFPGTFSWFSSVRPLTFKMWKYFIVTTHTVYSCHIRW